MSYFFRSSSFLFFLFSLSLSLSLRLPRAELSGDCQCELAARTLDTRNIESAFFGQRARAGSRIILRGKGKKQTAKMYVIDPAFFGFFRLVRVVDFLPILSSLSPFPLSSSSSTSTETASHQHFHQKRRSSRNFRSDRFATFTRSGVFNETPPPPYPWHVV